MKKTIKALLKITFALYVVCCLGVGVFGSVYITKWAVITAFQQAKAWAHAQAGVAPVPEPLAARGIDRLLVERAEEAHLPPVLIRAIARQESGLDNTAQSSAGALGALQVMPQHVKFCGLTHWSELIGPGEQVIENNIDCGIRVLIDCMESMRDIKKSLACYYAGPTYAKKGAAIKAAAERYASQVIDRLNNEQFVLLNKTLRGEGEG